ncbi:MAG: hypothetical protein KKE20_07115 [Nanoarchaeota archaeon]|nr:hypothetical protein [Nanoarchaeota archaeon]
MSIKRGLNKRAQAELPPLINLWWVIGTAGAILLGIILFTLFTSQKAEEDSCVFDIGPCEDAFLTQDTISFYLHNDLGKDIHIVNVEVKGCDSGDPWLDREVDIAKKDYSSIDIQGCKLTVDKKAHLEIELANQDGDRLEFFSGIINSVVEGQN